MTHSEHWQQMIAQSFHPRDWFVEKDWAPTDQPLEDSLMWVYRHNTDGTWLVGFYSPNREWNQDSTFSTKDEAVARVHYLNGGQRTDYEAVHAAARKGFAGT